MNLPRLLVIESAIFAEQELDHGTPSLISLLQGSRVCLLIDQF